MGEVVSTHPSKAGRGWLNITLRVLVGVLMLLAVVGLLLNVAGIVGVWVGRGYTSSNVIAVASTVTDGLEKANNGLTRVNDQVQMARQTVAQVNEGAAKLGDKVLANSPIATRLRQLVENTLSPRVDNARMTATTIRDAVVSVKAALVLLNRLPGVMVPTLNDQLGSLSDRAESAQAAVQDLRAKLADIKAGTVAKARAVVTQLTARIDAQLASIQAVVGKYKATVLRAHDRVTTVSNQILTLLTVVAVTVTLLALVFSAGLVLLILYCWQFVRKGRFPSLRISIETGDQ